MVGRGSVPSSLAGNLFVRINFKGTPCMLIWWFVYLLQDVEEVIHILSSYSLESTPVKDNNKQETTKREQKENNSHVR